MKKVSLIVLVLGMVSSSAWADCMPKYMAEMREAKKQMDARSGIDMECIGKMGCLMPMTTLLGIPNMTATSQYVASKSTYDRLLSAYQVIREAESGGGVRLIEFRDAIRNSEKGLKSVDLDYVAQAIREANNKDFFCAAVELVDVDQMKKIVISLL